MNIPHYEVENEKVDIAKHKRNSYKLRVTSYSRTLSLRKWGIRVAAVLVPAIIAVTILITTHKAENDIQPIAQEITVSTIDNLKNDERIADGKHITVAENATITLPDNSTVRIGKGGEIRHAENFTGHRDIELKGEAHFNVTKATTENDKFTVHTNHLDVTVLGTEFDVHCPAGDDHSSIDLLHGSVSVSVDNSEYLMKPGEHLHYRHSTGEVEITTIPIDQRRYDSMPDLVFDGQTLADVFETIENNYNVNIEYNNISNISKNIRADLSNGNTMDGIMKILSTITGRFTYQITADTIIITLKE